MVPEGWKWRKLGEVAELQRGFDLPKASRIEGSVPIISSGGISGYHNEHKAEAPGVVTGRYGSIGDVFFVEENFWPLNTSLWVKNFHGNHAKFIYYLLSKFEFSKFSDKTGVPGVNRNDLHAVKVGVPPQPEQKKIAQILSTWDQAITTTERLLENSQQRKKGLMQQLLTGKKRLPGFEGEWLVCRLGDLFAERNEIGGENLALLSITSNDGVVNQDETGRKDTSNADKSKYKRICPGDIGYNTMRMWQGRSSLSDKDGLVSPAYTILKPSNEANSLYFSYLFKLPAMIHVFYRNSQGLVSDTWNLKYKHLKNISWKVPPESEQAAIAKILLTADYEINALKVQRDHLTQEKKALMQQLLTGKRRVNVDTEAA